jgi:hypothetical protein
MEAEILVLSQLCCFRETPDETFVELVDVSVLETLAAADGEYTAICMSEHTLQDIMTVVR